MIFSARLGLAISFWLGILKVGNFSKAFKMVKVMRMGVGALAFAAMDAFGHEAMEYVQDEQARVTKVRLIIFWGIFLI